MSLERYKADDVVRLNSPTISTLEYYLEWLIDEAIIQTDGGRHPYVDSIAPILDAALEYWLMKDERFRTHLQVSDPWPKWNPVYGWQYLEDDNA